MGAVSALLFVPKYLQETLKMGVIVRALVLDCPFSSLKSLMFEIAANKTNLPQFLFHPVISAIMEHVKKTIGVDILEELDILEKYKRIEHNPELLGQVNKIKALFLTSKDDRLVNYSHVENLCKNTPFGQK